jgi:hypothetical protein
MAGIALAGRLAPLITKAASGLGKSGVGQTVRNAAAATAKGIRKEGVAEALNQAAPQAIGEGLAGLFQGGIGAGVGAGAANLGTSALLGAIAGPAAGRTGIRAIAANPLTQQIAGAVTSQAAIGLLGNRSRSIPAQTITPDQQIQAMQLQAQLQGNQLSANSQDLISALNAGNAVTSSVGSLFNTAPYQVTSFDA